MVAAGEADNRIGHEYSILTSNPVPAPEANVARTPHEQSVNIAAEAAKAQATRLIKAAAE